MHRSKKPPRMSEMGHSLLPSSRPDGLACPQCPESGGWPSRRRLSRCANFKLMQCSKKQRHSIASSARASSVNRSCLIWITTEGRCFVLLSPTYGSQFPL